jgi:trigger factor
MNKNSQKGDDPMTKEKKTEEKEQIQNIVTVTDAGPCKKKIEIEVPEEKIKETIKTQYTDLRKDAVLPGFRPGRAPLRLLEKRFGKDVSEQTKLRLIADALEQVQSDEKLDILGEPEVDHEEIKLPDTGSLKFDFEVNVRPEFELPELEGIEVEKPKLEVSEEDVNKQLEQLRKRQGTIVPREEGGVEPGDQVLADITLDVEGAEEKDVLHDSDIYISDKEDSPTTFVGRVPVEGFVEIIKGKKAGDKFTVDTEVAEDFFNKEYAGKKVSIEIRINEIKYLKPAEIDEEFLSGMNLGSEDELKDIIREYAENANEQQARQEMSQSVYSYLLDNTSLELPEDLVSSQAADILRRQRMRLAMQGVDEAAINQRMDDLRKSSEEEAARTLKTFFILDAVAEKLNVSVSEDEINGYIYRMAMQQNRRPEKVRSELIRNGQLQQFTMEAREQKCIDMLLEKASVKEVNQTDSRDTKAQTKKKAAPKKKTAKKAETETAEKKTETDE